MNSSRPIPRYNFRKANWEIYRKEHKSHIQMYKCTSTFPKSLLKAAKINIPRGFRKNYIPGWSTESEELYKEYTAHQTTEK